MTLSESNRSDSNSLPHRNGRGARPRRRWYERTSVTLCVAAVLVVVSLGFFHVITGVTGSEGLPFDVVLRESFGYREMVVNARRIQALPYAAARLKHPLGVAVLQRNGYMPSGLAFEAEMAAEQRESLERWQRQFEESLCGSTLRWQDRLRGDIPDGGSAQAHNQRGIALARGGEYAQALAEFSRAIARDPALADAFYNRAMVQIALGNLGPAASDLGKVTEVRPDFTEGYIRRGRLCVAMNEYDRAIADFTRAIEIDARSAEAYFHRSLAHYTKGDYEKALADVRVIQGLGRPVPAGLLHALRGTRDADTARMARSRNH
jgi:tetratricopeptide (TPR) repeat protein